MANRYEEVNDNVVEVFMKVVEKYFPEVGQLKIKLIFDIKKKTTSGKLTLAYVQIVNEQLKFLTKTKLLEDGYDYLIIINKVAWDVANIDDKIRLMRHELRHIFVDEDGKCKLLPHDVEDFSEEIELNRDDPNWGHRLGITVQSKYDDMKKGAK